MASSSRYRRAFTLVELLVVIGIIAVLIALLLPTLGRARQQAQRTACAAKLHNILIAAQNHSIDHKGFYPITGVLPGQQPPDFDDFYSYKYSYLSYDYAKEKRMIAPITIALASEMTYGKALLATSNDGIGVAETDDGSYIKNYICPSEAAAVSELNQVSTVLPMIHLGFDSITQEGIYYTEAQSYVFNEGVLGWGRLGDDPSGRLRGRVAGIRQASRTMFVADGMGGSIYRNDMPFFTGHPMTTIYNTLSDSAQVDGPVSSSCTLADALTNDGLAGDSNNFDLIRHRGKINIGFCDGHVETRYITASDLSSVFILAP
jgi:prepilin-type processing-associated H-X9-DG protein/prepilin-type N-terminal cleavage/methylation domain-containing protein